jgi:hypothetical protein
VASAPVRLGRAVLLGPNRDGCLVVLTAFIRIWVWDVVFDGLLCEFGVSAAMVGERASWCCGEVGGVDGCSRCCPTICVRWGVGTVVRSGGGRDGCGRLYRLTWCGLLLWFRWRGLGALVWGAIWGAGIWGEARCRDGLGDREIGDGVGGGSEGSISVYLIREAADRDVGYPFREFLPGGDVVWEESAN